MSSVPPPPPMTPPPPMGAEPTPDAGSFFSSLFDTSFKTFITPKIVKVVFIIGIVISALYGLLFLVLLARGGAGGLIFGLILAPIVFLVAVISLRLYLEVVMILFRIESNTRKQ